MVSVLPVPYNVNSNMASSNSHYGYVQPPPSPPADDSTKCSLPSISNLLGLADAGSPTSESASHSGSPISGPRSETRPSSSQYSPPNKAMPPTPPMPAKPSFNSYSPARQSIPQQKPAAPMTSVSGPGYYYETTPPLDDQRIMPRIQTTPTPQTYTPPPPPPQSYGHSYSLPPFYSAPPPPPGMPGMYYQRPLPQFPPMMATPGANVWQHHHYMSPVSGTPYTQSQDRYICQTCNKAFSRPSSLRIHSHSHTGEKPFKCPHPGCGKAFSVRSNMKRHERGCHNYDSSSSSSHSRNSSPHA